MLCMCICLHFCDHDTPGLSLQTFLSAKKVLSSTKHRSFYGTVHIIDSFRFSDETNKQKNLFMALLVSTKVAFYNFVHIVLIPQSKPV